MAMILLVALAYDGMYVHIYVGVCTLICVHMNAHTALFVHEILAKYGTVLIPQPPLFTGCGPIGLYLFS